MHELSHHQQLMSTRAQLSYLVRNHSCSVASFCSVGDDLHLRFLSLELNLALRSASEGEPGLDLDSARLLLPDTGECVLYVCM
jgi:hypothetical protein